MAWVYAFLGFALLIVVHEAGHFVAAKAVGMRVEKFSLFFGRMLVKRTIGETEYGIAWIPLGGYVKITGMNPGEVFPTKAIEQRAYYNQPVWKRIVVIAAGPAVNIVLAFFLAWAFYLSTNHQVLTPSGLPVASATVGQVVPHSPASRVLKAGDVVVSIDGVRGDEATMHRQIQEHACAGGVKRNGCVATTPVTLVVRRDGVLHTVKLRPTYSKADSEMLIGVEFNLLYAGDGVGYSAGHSVSGLAHVTGSTLSVIGQIFKAKDRKQINGIVGAYTVTAQAFQTSASQALQILAVISLSLGIINLFPFLPLDGGHILWAVVEKLSGKSVSLATMERASLVGVALVVMLFIIGLNNSIQTLTNGGFGVH